MEILRNTHIDFLKYRRYWLVVSILGMAWGVMALSGVLGRLNFGIDFAGGTQVILQFRTPPETEEIRSVLRGAGLEAHIQRFSGGAGTEVMIRTPGFDTGEDMGRQIRNALGQRFNPDAQGRLDLNLANRDELASLLLRQDPDGVAAGGEAALAHYREAAQAILDLRSEHKLIPSWQEVAALPEVSPAARALLESQAYLGAFVSLGQEHVGPQIGSELRTRGFWAVVLSLIGMLIYIWLRFELRYAVGTVVASIHDVLVTLGLFAAFGFEFNLTTIAAFLTLVGYSVNDSVVLFDRVRENLRAKRREELESVLNLSINQTLSRTLLTSSTTLLASGALLAFGGEVLRGFAFVITVGVVVGTYSTVYIASPVALLWERLVGARGHRTAKLKSAA